MKKLLLLLPLLVLISCGDKHMALDRAKPTATKPQSGGDAAAVTYVRDIMPLFQRSCSACHNEGSAIPNWNNYDVSFAKKDRLLERVVIKKDMPLGMPMSDEERALIAEWLKLGAPEGTHVAAPAPAPTPEATPEATPEPTPDPTPEPAPETAPVPPTSPESELLTYSKVKTEVFDKYCALCHNENSGDMMPNWGSYSVVSSRKDKVFTRAVLEKNMPPPGMPFSEEARDMLKKWIDNGAIE